MPSFMFFLNICQPDLCCFLLILFVVYFSIGLGGIRGGARPDRNFCPAAVCCCFFFCTPLQPISTYFRELHLLRLEGDSVTLLLDPGTSQAAQTGILSLLVFVLNSIRRNIWQHVHFVLFWESLPVLDLILSPKARSPLLAGRRSRKGVGARAEPPHKNASA